MSVLQIDLNADVGESFYDNLVGHDEELIPLVSSVNVACGFHGGDPLTLQRAIDVAILHGVKVGAHPSFYDLKNFGRKELTVSPKELEVQIVYQLAALSGILKTRGASLHHVKLHGALYHQVNVNSESAQAVLKGIQAVCGQTILVVGFAQSSYLKLAEQKGFRVVHEAFIDRNYQADGTLVPRSQSGAMIENSDEALKQALKIVNENLPVKADTLCIHGDHAGSVETARKIRKGLESAGIKIASTV